MSYLKSNLKLRIVPRNSGCKQIPLYIQSIFVFHKYGILNNKRYKHLIKYCSKIKGGIDDDGAFA